MADMIDLWGWALVYTCHGGGTDPNADWERCRQRADVRTRAETPPLAVNGQCFVHETPTAGWSGSYILFQGAGPHWATCSNARFDEGHRYRGPVTKQGDRGGGGEQDKRRKHKQRVRM